jgi:superfamily II DNA helicase RecQ
VADHKVLLRLCKERPTSLEAFARVEGVSKLMVDKYGVMFLSLIRLRSKHCDLPTDTGSAVR